jgi:hypothetical protein
LAVFSGGGWTVSRGIGGKVEPEGEHDAGLLFKRGENGWRLFRSFGKPVNPGAEQPNQPQTEGTEAHLWLMSHPLVPRIPYQRARVLKL